MRKNIFEIYNEQHANETPKSKSNENYVKTENPEVVKSEPETKTDPEQKTDLEPKTNIEDVGRLSLSEERGDITNEL